MFCGKINSSKFKLQDLCHQIGEIEWTVKINQRVPKANLWIINYCILEMKPAISLPVYFTSVKKWKYVLRKNNKKKTKGQKKKGKRIFQRRESNPEPSTCKVTPLYIAPRQLTCEVSVNLIIFNTFGHEILPVDTLQAVVSPGRTLRYEGRDTTASIRLLLWSSRLPALWTNKLTLNM